MSKSSAVHDTHPPADLQLQDAQVDTGVQPQSSLVGAQSRVVLYSVTSVDLELTLVVLPGDSELDDTLGNLDDGEGFSVLGVLGEEGLLRGSNWTRCRSVSVRSSGREVREEGPGRTRVAATSCKACSNSGSGARWDMMFVIRWWWGSCKSVEGGCEVQS